LNGNPTVLGVKDGYYEPHQYVPHDKYSACQVQFPLPTVAKGAYTFSFHKADPCGAFQQVDYLEYDIETYYEHYWYANPGIEYYSENDLAVFLKFPNTDVPLEMSLKLNTSIQFATFEMRYDSAPTQIWIQSKSPIIMGGFKLEAGHVATPSAVGSDFRLGRLSPIQVHSIQGVRTSGYTGFGMRETLLRGNIPQELVVHHTGGRTAALTLEYELGPLDMQEEQALIYGLAALIDRTTLMGGQLDHSQQYRAARAEEYKNIVTGRVLHRKGRITRGLA
jgi:hypothetical protein